MCCLRMCGVLVRETRVPSALKHLSRDMQCIGLAHTLPSAAQLCVRVQCLTARHAVRTSCCACKAGRARAALCCPALSAKRRMHALCCRQQHRQHWCPRTTNGSHVFKRGHVICARCPAPVHLSVRVHLPECITERVPPCKSPCALAPNVCCRALVSCSACITASMCCPALASS